VVFTNISIYKHFKFLNNDLVRFLVWIQMVFMLQILRVLLSFGKNWETFINLENHYPWIIIAHAAPDAALDPDLASDFLVAVFSSAAAGASTSSSSSGPWQASQ